MTIQGYSTPAGTRRFAERFANSPDISGSHYRVFDDGIGTGGLMLSSLGLGTYLGSPTPEDDARMAEAAVVSVESGAVNVIDTAINYRCQLSERSIGSALDRLKDKGFGRDELFIATKNGFLTPDAAFDEDFRSYFQREFIDTGIVIANEIAGGIHCMSPKYLSDQLERSRKNLGLETIDLMYLHNAAESQLPVVGRPEFMHRLKAAFAFYEAARRENKIRYYGMATWNCFRVKQDHPEYLALEEVIDLARTIGGDRHGFRFIQLPYNLALTEAQTLQAQPLGESMTSTLEAAKASGIGVFTSVPLMQGQLLDQDALPAFGGLTTPAQRCLQFVRSQPGIIAPLVGHKTPDHVQDNLAVAKVSSESRT